MHQVLKVISHRVRSSNRLIRCSMFSRMCTTKGPSMLINASCMLALLQKSCHRPTLWLVLLGNKCTRFNLRPKQRLVKPRCNCKLWFIMLNTIVHEVQSKAQSEIASVQSQAQASVRKAHSIAHSVESQALRVNEST